MSLAKTIVLTRDADGCARSLRAWEPIFTNNLFIIAPVRRIEVLQTKNLDLSRTDAVIFTSFNSVRFCQNLLVKKAYCVGEKTADAARGKGFDVQIVCPTSQALISRLKSLEPMTFLHISGRPFSVDFSTVPAILHHRFQVQICYEVIDENWSEDERSRLLDCETCLFPVFSRASASSLIENLKPIQSQFCAEILPISVDVGDVFQDIDKIWVHSPPQIPNFASITAALMNLLDEI